MDCPINCFKLASSHRRMALETPSIAPDETMSNGAPCKFP